MLIESLVWRNETHIPNSEYPEEIVHSMCLFSIWFEQPSPQGPPREKLELLTQRPLGTRLWFELISPHPPKNRDIVTWDLTSL